MGPANAVYPIALRLQRRPCLVVGGGAVGVRKAVGLLASGANVTLIAPRVADDIDRLEPPVEGPGSLQVQLRPYRSGEAASYRLVVAATGIKEVDRAVAADADAAGVWVNCADDPDCCTFFLPAVHHDGPVSVAVSTGGASPALAAWLRDRLAGELGPNIGVLAEMLATARGRILDAGSPVQSSGWRSLLEGPLPRLVRDGRFEEARRLLEAWSP